MTLSTRLLICILCTLGLQANPTLWKSEGWTKTDFSKSSISFHEVRSGGPGRDDIPPIDRPNFITSSQSKIPDREAVIVVVKDNIVRAYPIRILMWHEIVNDRLGDFGLAITYCPLCDATRVFESDFPVKNNRFGVTGKLRFSDMLMWDRATESWWQQFTGMSVIGKLNGSKLKIWPHSRMSFARFKKQYPSGEIMSSDTGHQRHYGMNPYSNYDRSSPFFPHPNPANNLGKMQRVLGIQLGKLNYYLPFSALAKDTVVYKNLPKCRLRVDTTDKGASSLDADRIENSRDILFPRLSCHPAEFSDKTPDFYYGSFLNFAWQAFYPESIQINLIQSTSGSKK